MSNYYSFDELKNELGLSEDDIKKMVSEGELRAFRDEDTMKFKREDVEALRRQKGGGGAALDDDDIILLDDDDAGGGELTEELVLEDDDDFGVGGTEALDTQDTFVEAEVGGVTEPIEVIDDDDDIGDLPPVTGTGSRRMAAPRASASRRVAVAAPAAGGATWVAVVQILLCASLLYGGAFVFGLLTDHNTPATKVVTDWMYEQMHKKQPERRVLEDR